MSEQEPGRTTSPTGASHGLVAMLAIVAVGIAVLVIPVVVIAIVWGGLAAALSFSLLAALIGIAALAFTRYANRYR